jgi:hypothetical protein
VIGFIIRAIDSDEDPEWEHRHWQSDWQHAITQAYEWALAGLVVYERAPDEVSE